MSMSQPMAPGRAPWRRKGAPPAAVAEVCRGRLSLLRLSLLSGLLLVISRAATADRPTGPCATQANSEAAISLVYGGMREVTRRSGGRSLRELSGIALQGDDSLPAGFWIWLVDDSKRNLFRADVNGEIGSSRQHKIELGTAYRGDLEGLLFRPEDDSLYTIREGGYEIVRIDLSRGVAEARIGGTHPLSAMAGYATVTASNAAGDTPLSTYLSSGLASNEGLEGIAYFSSATAANRGQGSFFVVKEKNPGLLIEIDNSLGSILGFTILNCGDYPADTSCDQCTCPDREKLPFTDRVDDVSRDFTGLSYDSRRGKLWIASDTSTALFLYDVADLTYSTFPLFTDAFGDCVQQAEGVTYIESVDGLAVVGDRQDSAPYFRYDIVER